MAQVPAQQRRVDEIRTADPQGRDGCSRLTRAGEEGTIARIRSLRRELIEFPSSVDAFRCGVAVQREMVSRNGSELVESFCVAKQVGDVVIESDGELMGV